MDKSRLHKLHVLSFDTKYRKEIKNGYTRAGPYFDAWMCVLGKQRKQFNVKKLKKHHHSVVAKINELRDVLKINLTLVNKEEKAR